MKAAERTNAAWHELQIVPLAPRGKQGISTYEQDAAVFPGGNGARIRLRCPQGRGSASTLFSAFFTKPIGGATRYGRVALSFRLTGKVRLGFTAAGQAATPRSLLQELDLSGDGSRVRALLPDPFASGKAKVPFSPTSRPCRKKRRLRTCVGKRRPRHAATRALPSLSARSTATDIWRRCCPASTLRREGLIHNVIVVNNGEPGLEKRRGRCCRAKRKTCRCYCANRRKLRRFRRFHARPDGGAGGRQRHARVAS